jgi:hypothetical protein
MVRIDLRQATRTVAGAVAGLALWWVLAPHYNRPVAAATQSWMRLTEAASQRQLTPAVDGHVIVSDAERGGSTVFTVPGHYLTLNLALLVALLAYSGRALSLPRLLTGLVILFAGHVAGLYSAVQARYANDLGAWSREHYSALSRDAWLATSQFYRLIGMYALVFLVWWMIAEMRAAGGDDGAKKRRIGRGQTARQKRQRP